MSQEICQIWVTVESRERLRELSRSTHLSITDIVSTLLESVEIGVQAPEITVKTDKPPNKLTFSTGVR